MGIKDLYVKLEGAPNNLHIVKAFFLGMLRQRSHQTLADEKGLHLVELRAENDFFPRVSEGYFRIRLRVPNGDIASADGWLDSLIASAPSA